VHPPAAEELGNAPQLQDGELGSGEHTTTSTSGRSAGKES
jgi:hypothetical protein